MRGKILRVALCALIFILLQESSISEDTNETMETNETSPEGCNCADTICEDTSEDKCPHGLVSDTRDPCRCCRRCGNGEYEFCDSETLSAKELSEKKHNFGRCGKGLTCRANHGVPPGARPEMICYCQDERMVCGSDGVTYETECRLNKTAFETGRSVVRKAWGMCEGVPRVVTTPVHVKNSTNTNVYLQCEVMGNPVPRVEWRKVLPDGPGDFIPSGNSGSDRVTVQTRGGPEEYEVTGWLQIARLEVEDGGVYECVGINKLGQDSGRANVTVVPRLEPDSPE